MNDEELYLIFDPREAHRLSMAQLEFNIWVYTTCVSELRKRSSGSDSTDGRLTPNKDHDYVQGMLIALKKVSGWWRHDVRKAYETEHEHPDRYEGDRISPVHDGQQDIMACVLEAFLTQRESDLKILDILGWNDNDEKSSEGD